MAMMSRPGPLPPASYLAYSRLNAIPPTQAINRNTKPVTSSHSWCKTLPNDEAVARHALTMALSVRLRLACWATTRATMPTLRVKGMPATRRFYQCSALQ